MILYKYYSYSAGISALKSGNVGFRKPTYFNDPLELSYYSEVLASQYPQKKKAINDISNSVVVLSLTNTKTNPLMWAHYGDEHRGFCIGYDVDDKFFSSNQYCLVPVGSGAVRYLKDKPASVTANIFSDQIHPIVLQAHGLDEDLGAEAASIAEQLYLTKSPDWEYENEVRVVKVVDSFFEESHIFQSDARRSFYTLGEEISEDRPHSVRQKVPGLYIYYFKPTIRSITMGLRNPITLNSSKSYSAEDLQVVCGNDLAALEIIEKSPSDWSFCVTGYTPLAS